jgi:ribonuclease P protein subunit POP4
MKEILADELIGLEVRVVESSDRSKVGAAGKVVDETFNTLVVRTKDGEKVLPKEECVFSFKYKGKNVAVDGKMLLSRPEDRIKKSAHIQRKWRFPSFFFK